MRPLVTRTSDPVGIIPLEVIAEYIGYDSALDLSQDKVIPVLRDAAIQAGEQNTGAVWAEAGYSMVSMHPPGIRGPVCLPLSPATSVSKVVIVDAQGNETTVPASEYVFIPSAIDLYRPWATLDLAVSGRFNLVVEFKAGWTKDTFPKSLQTWALIRIATLYDYREDLVTGTITANMPRDHAVGLLDRWRVYGGSYA